MGDTKQVVGCGMSVDNSKSKDKMESSLWVRMGLEELDSIFEVSVKS